MRKTKIVDVTPATPSGLSPKDEQTLNGKCKAWLADLEPYKNTKEKKRLEQSQSIYVGNIWEMAGGIAKQFSGDKLSLLIPKATVDMRIATVTQFPFAMKVVADSLVGFPKDHPYVTALTPYLSQLALKSEDNGRIATELLTHALSTVREQTRLDAKVRVLMENADVDGACYFKDGIRLSARDNTTQELTVDLIRAKDLWKDSEALTFDEIEWFCELIPTTVAKIRKAFPQYDPNYQGQGGGTDIEETQTATTHKKGSTGEKKVLEEWWIKDLSLTKDKDNIELPAYPGGWKRVYRFRGQILECKPNPYPHGNHPYHQLVGVTDPNSTNGLMLVLDVLASPAYASSKALSMALLNLYLTCSNKRLINPDAVVNPAKLEDNSVSNVVLKQGKTFAEAVMPLQGQEVSASYGAIIDMVDRKLAQVSGASSIPPPGASEGSSDIVASGLDVGLYRGRVKETLRSVAYNLVMNMCSFVNVDTSFRMMGGIGAGPANFIRFNPAIFKEVFENFDARCEIQIEDDSGLDFDPEQLKAMSDSLEAVAKIRASDPTIPMSTALEALPPMPGKTGLIQLFYKQEQKAQQENRPDPKQLESQLQLKSQRGDAAVEATKQCLVALKTTNPLAVINMAANGTMDILLQLAQGVATPEQVASMLALFPPDIAPSVQEWLKLNAPPQPLQLGGAPGPTSLPGAPNPNAAPPQGS